MAKQTKLACVIADLHAGSSVGLMPPGFVTAEKNPVSMNAYQRWLWECWKDTNSFIREVKGKDPMHLVLNGDTVEGIHHRTTQLIDAEKSTQIKAALALTEPLAELADKTYVVRGTECHTGLYEETLGEILGAVEDHQGNRSHDRVSVSINGCRCVFLHHVTTTVRTWTEGTGLSAALAQEQVEAAKNGEEIPQVLGVAHRHRFGYFNDGTGLCIVSPPWQGLTRHGHKVVGHARTKPGVYLLDWRGLPEGSLPRVHYRVYKPAASGRLPA